MQKAGTPWYVPTHLVLMPQTGENMKKRTRPILYNNSFLRRQIGVGPVEQDHASDDLHQ